MAPSRSWTVGLKNYYIESGMAKPMKSKVFTSATDFVATVAFEKTAASLNQSGRDELQLRNDHNDVLAVYLSDELQYVRGMNAYSLIEAGSDVGM